MNAVVPLIFCLLLAGFCTSLVVLKFFYLHYPYWSDLIHQVNGGLVSKAAFFVFNEKDCSL